MPKHRGRGISAIEYPTGMNQNGDPSQAWIKIKPDGRVDVFSGTSDIGNGSKTIQSQIVAETLGVPYDWITYDNSNTDSSPLCTGTFASRATFVSAMALRPMTVFLIRISLCSFIALARDDWQLFGSEALPTSHDGHRRLPSARHHDLPRSPVRPAGPMSVDPFPPEGPPPRSGRAGRGGPPRTGRGCSTGRAAGGRTGNGIAPGGTHRGDSTIGADPESDA